MKPDLCPQPCMVRPGPTTIMENQMEKKMENEMENIGVILGLYWGCIR